MTAMHPSDRHYRNQTLRLADFTVVADVIEDVTFENCILEGPAVVALIGTTALQNSSIDGDMESILWVVPNQRERVLGAVALVDCQIIACTLRRIGFAILERDVDGFTAGFGG